jgi:hypothetical protein
MEDRRYRQVELRNTCMAPEGEAKDGTVLMAADERALTLGGAVKVAIAALAKRPIHPGLRVSGIGSQVIEVGIGLGVRQMACRDDQREHDDRKQNPDSMCCHRGILPKWPTARRPLPGSVQPFIALAFVAECFP